MKKSLTNIKNFSISKKMYQMNNTNIFVILYYNY